MNPVFFQFVLQNQGLSFFSWISYRIYQVDIFQILNYIYEGIRKTGITYFFSLLDHISLRLLWVVTPVDMRLIN